MTNGYKDEYGGGWIGVDLDGTLAEYHGFKGPGIIGKPIPKMVDRVRGWVANGTEVRILTARVSSNVPKGKENYPAIARKAIVEWSIEHIGMALRVTSEKDYLMRELWDDRCIQVVFNRGTRVGGE